MSLPDSLKILGLLPFSGFTLTELLTLSISVHLSLQASPILIPVSLSSCRIVAVFRQMNGGVATAVEISA